MLILLENNLVDKDVSVVTIVRPLTFFGNTTVDRFSNKQTADKPSHRHPAVQPKSQKISSSAYISH